MKTANQHIFEQNFKISETKNVVQISVSGDILEYDCQQPLQNIARHLSSNIKELKFVDEKL